MMCQRIGCPPISTIGLGLTIVSSDRRDPTPPARIATFMEGQLPEEDRGRDVGPGRIERLAPAERKLQRKGFPRKSVRAPPPSHAPGIPECCENPQPRMALRSPRPMGQRTFAAARRFEIPARTNRLVSN